MANKFGNLLVVVVLVLASSTALLLATTQQANAFELVDTGVSEIAPDGKHVAVNIPGFFNMVLDTRGPQKGIRMTQSIMMGFVKVNMDRLNGTDGQMRGPMKVSVAGITVYNNRQPPLEEQNLNSPQ